MKRRIVLSLALLAGLVALLSASDAKAFDQFGGDCGCAAEASCCGADTCGDPCGHRHGLFGHRLRSRWLNGCCEPACDPCGRRHGLFGGLFHRHNGCCEPTGCEPACAAPAPVADCCEPACDPCGRRHGLFHHLRHRWNRGCCEPSCGAVEPTCCG